MPGKSTNYDMQGNAASGSAGEMEPKQPPAASGEGEHEHLVPSNKVAKIAAGQATDAVAEKSRILAPLLGDALNFLYIIY